MFARIGTSHEHLTTNNNGVLNMAKEIIQELCPRTKCKVTSIPMIEHLELTSRIDAKCTFCGNRLFTEESLNRLSSIRIEPGTLNLSQVVDGHVKGYRETDEFKWLLCGMGTRLGVIYRTVCWNCFRSNLRERAHDGKHLIPSNTKKNSWWMRVIRGEDAYPGGKASAIGKYWADLMFTTLTKDELDSLSTRFDTASKESFILRYGEEEGNRRYEEYVKFQSDKNKFEYKHEHLGWSKEQFNEFNKGRAVTLELCVKKHGEELGRRIFKEYCEKQEYAGCKLEYFVEKYGKEKGTAIYQELNNKKSLNRETFVRKYGEVEGERIWKAYWIRRSHNTPVSEVSQRLFDEILSQIPSNQYSKVKYASFGGEQPILGRNGYMFPDFLYDNKKIIEFNGDYWHKNPKLYVEDDESRLKWKQDSDRKSELERLGYEVLVVWEKDFHDNKQEVIHICLKFLGIE